jgi:serine/threonine protein kinase
MRTIRHPNLLTIFGMWRRDATLVIAMELADRTLLDRCNEAVQCGLPGIPFGELLRYMRQTALGIDYLNAPRHVVYGKEGVGIQHRDLKPQNLLLIGNTVKVADFDLAKMMETVLASNTGNLTPAYAPPEFFRGQTSSRSDQYSLAVSYCQLRGGRLPFTGSHWEIMLGHSLDAPDLTMLPEHERTVVARALAKDPEDRWPTCRAFVRQLRIGHRATNRYVAELAHEETPERPPPRSAKGLSGGLLATAGLFAFAGAFGVAVFLRSPSADKPYPPPAHQAWEQRVPSDESVAEEPRLAPSGPEKSFDEEQRRKARIVSAELQAEIDKLRQMERLIRPTVIRNKQD